MWGSVVGRRVPGSPLRDSAQGKVRTALHGQSRNDCYGMGLGVVTRLAYGREGFAHGGTGGRCGGRGSVSTCVAIGGSGECARQRFVPSRAYGFWLGGALFLVHPSVQKHLGDPSPSSSQGQRASDARTRVEVGDTVVVGSRSLSSSKLHGRRPNPAEELRSAFGQWFCATNPVTCLADASLYQATNVGRRFRPLGTAGAKMWSDHWGLGANGPTMQARAKRNGREGVSE